MPRERPLRMIPKPWRSTTSTGGVLPPLGAQDWACIPHSGSHRTTPVQPRAWHLPAPLDSVGAAEPCRANSLTMAWRNVLIVPPIFRPSLEILLPDHCHRGRACPVLHLIEAACLGQSSMALAGQSPEIRPRAQRLLLAKLRRQPQGPKSKFSRRQSRPCDRARFSYRATIVLEISRPHKR